MTFKDFIEVIEMVKETEKGLSSGRFWGLVATFGGGWLLYAAAQLVDAFNK